MRNKILIGVGVLVLLIIILIWSGALKFSGSVGFNKGSEENQSSSPAPASEFVLPEGWVRYTSGEFGYSIAYPDGWNVQEKNDGSREVLLVAPKSSSFVRISSFKDDSLTSAEAVEKSMADYKASFADKPNEQVKEFKSEMKNDLGYFGVSGFMLVNDVNYQFLERGILSPIGRVLIMRGAVDTRKDSMTQAEFDGFVKTVRQVMDSFRIQ